jgi:hypothetical protein
MIDILGWVMVFGFMAAIIWVLYPMAKKLMRITANEGDDAIRALSALKEKLNKKL